MTQPLGNLVPWTVMTMLVVATLFSSGCASTGGAYKRDRHYSERGLASWYGPGFHGKRAANGEIYDMNELTAAHRTLPFDTLVEVRNRDNGRRVRVRITDRGPFVRGRIIDLSYEGARQLEMLGPGVAPVEIRVVNWGSEVASAIEYWVQAGAFHDEDEANSLYRELRSDFPRVRLSSDGTWHRIRLGPFSKRKKAENTRRQLERRGVDAFLLQL